jgi:outer membrane protein
LIERAPGAQEAQEEFDRQMQSFTRELDALGAEIDTLVSQYQQQQSTLLPNVRQAREAEIQQREGRYQQRLGEIQEEADVARQRLMQPILQQITETIEALRAEGGYAIIFDVAGQSIVAADPALDLTEEVVSRLSAPASPAP